MRPSAAARLPAPRSLSHGLSRDPYAVYTALRAAGPIVWTDEAPGGAWMLTRYADIVAALKDPRLSAARADAFAQQFDPARQQRLAALTAAFARWMIFLDAPRHSRLRKALNHGFKPAMLEALRPRIERLVDELLAPMAGSRAYSGPGDRRAPFDFIRDFAHPLPVRVIAEMLGVPESEQPRFIAWSDDIVAFMGNLSTSFETALRAQDALSAMTDYFRELLERRGAQADRNDLTGLLLAAQRRGEFATDDELLAQCSMFFFAGHETTRNLLGNGLNALLEHPDQLARLRADPGLMPGALRELLRYDSPVQYTGRRALEDIELHGQTIRRGERVMLMLGAGNRDPERFSNPELLDLTRDEGPPLSFGYGPHVCIGATLSCLEAGIAFEKLFGAVPLLRCLDPEPQWIENAAFRGLRRLRLVPAEARDGLGIARDALR